MKRAWILGLLIAVTGLSGFGEIACGDSNHAGPQMVRLPGHTLPALKGATLVPSKPGDASQPLTLTIVLKRDDQPGFQRYLQGVYDSNSPAFHRFLTDREISARFGPAPAMYERLLSYLKDHEFEVIDGSSNRMTMTVRAPRAAIERTLGVRIGKYRFGKREFYANDRDPVLPASIAPYVEAVVGLSNLARPIRIGSTEIVSSFPPQEEGTLAFSCSLAEELESKTLPFSVSGMAVGLEVAPLDLNLSFIETVLRYQCAADELNLIAAYAVNPNPAFVRPRSHNPVASKIAPAAAVEPGSGQTVGLLEFDNFKASDVQNYLNLIGFGSANVSGQLSEVDVAGGAGAP